MKRKTEKGREVAAVVSEVTADFERRKAERRPYELQWKLNIDFYGGCQNSMMSSFGTVVQSGKQFWWQQREIFNHIGPMVEERLARLSAEQPEISVVPSDSDEDGKRRAEICRKVIESAFQKTGMDEIGRKALMWSEMTGTAFYKIIWDSSAGQKIGEVNGNPVFEGDVSVVVCSPFEIYPDSVTAGGVNEVSSIIHAKVYRAEEVREKWGAEVEGHDVDVFDFNGGLRAGKSVLDDAVIVIERFEAPSKKRPEGRLVTVAGDKLLYDGPLPFINAAGERRRLPFVRQTSESVPGCFFGKSVIERAIPVQRAYNAVKNRKTEFLNRLACGCLSVEDGSVDIDALESEGLAPGTVIVYRQGFSAPKFFEGGSLPGELEREEERLLKEFVTITGGSDLAGVAEAANASGIALQILADRDNRLMNRTVSEIMGAYASAAVQMLRLYRQFAVGRRLERLVSGNEIEIFGWNADSITSDRVCVEKRKSEQQRWYGR